MGWQCVLEPASIGKPSGVGEVLLQSIVEVIAEARVLALRFGLYANVLLNLAALYGHVMVFDG